MTRIAVLSDVHGNVPALEAAIADLAAQAVDEVLVGGDLVGRGPQGSAVVRRIAELGWRSIRGNHEEYLLELRRDEAPRDPLHPVELAAASWMADELGEDELAWIARLPFTLTAATDAGLRLVHGSPLSTREGIGPWLSDRRVGEHLDRVREDLLVCAHTHRPLHRRVNGGQVVNVGSVGLPFNGDRRAQYAIFERGPDGGWTVEPRKVPYDVARTLAIYERSGFDEAGGITARLLRLELEHASPVLVPFLRWSAAHGEQPDAEAVAAFLAVYRPGEPLGPFFERLAALG